jgi:hypothetical protein
VSYFEYEAVYFGIIVGLALANNLTSLHKLIEAGSRVRRGWLAPASAFYAATLTLGEFWSIWVRQHDMGHRTFLSWLPTAVAFALLFLMCAASLPDEAGDGVDLKRYYMDNRHRFWGFSAALHGLNLCSWTITFFEHGFETHYMVERLHPVLGNTVEAALSLSLIFVRATWWQVVGFAAIWAYALSYFGPLPLN